MRALRAGVMVVVVVGLATGGLALAQSGADDGGRPAVPPGAYERILDLLAPLVDDGTLTTDQAAAVAERLADRLPVTDRRPTDVVLARLAELLGMPTVELQEALAGGVTVAELAEQQGLALEELVAALLAPQRARLAAAVAAGELTEAEAAERLEEAARRLARRFTTPARDTVRDAARDRARFDAVLDTLGVEPGDLRAAAANGDSLADVAEQQGVATDELVGVLVAPLAERLEGAVASGQLSEDQAAAHLDRATSHATDRVARPIAERHGDRAPRDG